MLIDKILFKARHFMKVLLVLLVLESLCVGLYGYHAISENREHYAESLVSSSIKTAIILTSKRLDTQARQAHFLKKLLKYDAMHPNQKVSLQDSPPQGAVIIRSPEDTIHIQNAIDTLDRRGTVTVSVYDLSSNKWANFTLIDSQHQAWKALVLVLMLNIILITILWLGLFAYYKYAISRNVIQVIRGEEPDVTSDTVLITARIQQLLKERDLMLSALAHDIKTPLTEARLRLELLEDQTTAVQINEKLDQVHQIVRSSLEYAREPANLKKVPADVVSFVESIVEDYHDGVFDIEFSTNVDHHELNLALDLFKRLVTNIIDNAKKYANNARVSIFSTQDYVDVICEDHGPGVPKKFLPLLTVPYYRVDQSRSRATGGTGLGLAIVKKIAELHSGKVIIEPPETGQGFKVTVRFMNQDNLDHMV